jgi:hypothetical protein
MQFGVGLLGRDWTLEGAIKDQLANTLPANPNFHRFAANYAAKIAAETILSEHPNSPDLTDAGIVTRCAACARPVRLSEATMVRAAFLAEYGTYLEVAA